MEMHVALGFRDQLLDRRHKLEHAVTHAPLNEHLRYLLQEVDAALERIAAGTFGVCETCHEAIEEDRLQIDPPVEKLPRPPDGGRAARTGA
jgi:RNA polymerase-binding transcription factor DksA